MVTLIMKRAMVGDSEKALSGSTDGQSIHDPSRGACSVARVALPELQVTPPIPYPLPAPDIEGLQGSKRLDR